MVVLFISYFLLLIKFLGLIIIGIQSYRKITKDVFSVFFITLISYCLICSISGYIALNDNYFSDDVRECFVSLIMPDAMTFVYYFSIPVTIIGIFYLLYRFIKYMQSESEI